MSDALGEVKIPEGQLTGGRWQAQSVQAVTKARQEPRHTAALRHHLSIHSDV
jgi:hypothetical protein